MRNSLNKVENPRNASDVSRCCGNFSLPNAVRRVRGAALKGERMWGCRKALSLLVAVCLSVIPATAHAHHSSPALVSQTLGNAAAAMPDCPSMKDMLAALAKQEQRKGKPSGCEPAGCFLKCFHSCDVRLYTGEAVCFSEVFESDPLLPPRYAGHEPPTPPPQA